MFSVKLKCPHCGRVGDFTLRNVSEYMTEQPTPLGTVETSGQARARMVFSGQVVQGYGVAACNECRGPVMVQFECPRESLGAVRLSSGSFEWRYIGAPPKIIGTYPQLAEPDNSPHYPEKLRAVFVELQEDIKAKRTAPRIVVGCRSVMEVALRQLGYTDKDGNLLARIDKARADGLLTEGMREWAHKVRLDGNEATHELEASAEDARQLMDFIRLFLEVVFVLPERIKKAASTKTA